MMRVSAVLALAADPQGVIWARLAAQEHPFLSRYSEGKWVHYPLPAFDLSGQKDKSTAPVLTSPSLLKVLKDGALIAVGNWEGTAFLFDGKEWQAFSHGPFQQGAHFQDALKTMVEARYEWLKGKLDNRLMSWGTQTYIGLDDGGRIWLSGVGAFDGTLWQEFPPNAKGYCQFNATGDRCLSIDSLLDTSVWPPRELVRTGRDGFYQRWMFDDPYRSGRDPFCVATYADRLPSSKPCTAPITSKKEGEASGPDRYSWSFNPPDTVTVRWRDCEESQPYHHPSAMNPHVVHQGQNVYWVSASDGLLRLRLEGKGAQSRIVLDTH
jgi:hypothetical protein